MTFFWAGGAPIAGSVRIRCCVSPVVMCCSSGSARRLVRSWIPARVVPRAHRLCKQEEHSATERACEYRSAIADESLAARVGIHVGDIDTRDNDISGVNVVIAARLLALAAPGEILLSSTAVQAATGATQHFEPRGQHHLKGVPGSWQVFAVKA